MKKRILFLMLSLLLCLLGCSDPEPVTEIPAEENPTVVEAAPVQPMNPEKELPPMEPETLAVPRASAAKELYVFYPQFQGGPSVRIIGSDGRLVLGLTGGEPQLLMDQATGENTAILVWDAPDRPADDSYGRDCDIYAMDGRLLHRLRGVCDVKIFGETVILSTRTADDSGSVALYDRETGECIASGLHNAEPMGDCILVRPDENGNRCWFYDANGRKTESDQKIVSGTVAYGRCVLGTEDEQTEKQGLMGATGEILLPCLYDRVGLCSRYYYVKSGEQAKALDPNTGEVLFEWNGWIKYLYDHMAWVVNPDGTNLLVTRDGVVLYENQFGFAVRDFDDDGEPEYFFDGMADMFDTCIGSQGQVLFHRENTLLDSVDAVTLLARDTEKGTYSLVDLETGRERPVDQLPGLMHLETLSWYGPQFDGLFAATVNLNSFDEQLPVSAAYRVVDKEGNTVLSEIVDWDSRQGGVFLCRSGKYTGLRRLDGTWLYLPYE